MVNDFVQLNAITRSHPVPQLSKTEQLKYISRKVNCISLIDVTGCFHSLALNKDAQNYTGFDTGIPGVGRCYYLRVPIGAATSKNIQDNVDEEVL